MKKKRKKRKLARWFQIYKIFVWYDTFLCLSYGKVWLLTLVLWLFWTDSITHYSCWCFFDSATIIQILLFGSHINNYWPFDSRLNKFSMRQRYFTHFIQKSVVFVHTLLVQSFCIHHSSVKSIVAHLDFDHMLDNEVTVIVYKAYIQQKGLA